MMTCSTISLSGTQSSSRRAGKSASACAPADFIPMTRSRPCWLLNKPDPCFLVAWKETPVGAALEALKRAAGGWADGPEGLDRFLEWNRQQRQLNRRKLPE